MEIITNSGIEFGVIDWKIFLELFPDTGCIKLIKANKTAYIDENAARILGTELSGEITDSEFYALTERLQRHACENRENVYTFQVKNVTRWVNFYQRDDVTRAVCFVRDITAEVERENENAPHSVTDVMGNAEFMALASAMLEESGDGFFCMATLEIKPAAVNPAVNPPAAASPHGVVAALSATIRQFASDTVLIGGRRESCFEMLIKRENKKECYSLLGAVSKALTDAEITDANGIAIADRRCVNVGCCFYPEQARTAEQMAVFCDFAAFEIRVADGMIKEFSLDEYREQKNSFAEEQRLSSLLGGNRLNYHFQPIVDAHSGEIVAYEALMRVNTDPPLVPLELIALAEKHNRLRDIEKLTFHNALTFLAKNQQAFRSRKLFINSIASCSLGDAEFRRLMMDYGELLENLVVEITEQSDFSEELIRGIKRRYLDSGIELAIDDYGTGYSNTTNLLKSLPNYVKIDRALISNIQRDDKKQHFVSSVITFCRSNNIKVLAEGVETADELRWVIREGVDLIQGFFTSRPKPLLIDSISKEVRDIIVSTSLEKPDFDVRKLCEVHGETDIDLVKLALEKYTDVMICSGGARIHGRSDAMANINIGIAGDMYAEVLLDNVNARGIWKPTVIIGENSDITMKIEGDCTLSFEGISVPESSKLRIVGGGNLTINADHNNGVGIGANFETNYGNITVDLDGRLVVLANGDNSVCIGGGKNFFGSELTFLRGDVQLTATGANSLGLGSFDGNAFVDIGRDTVMRVRASGENTVGIGSFKHKVRIGCHGRTEVRATGRNAVAIGSANDGLGSVSIDGCNLSVVLKAANGAGVGSVRGCTDVCISGAKVYVQSEGEYVASIGDYVGRGNVSVNDSTVTVRQLGGEHSLEIGTLNGNVSVRDSNIEAKLPAGAQIT